MTTFPHYMTQERRDQRLSARVPRRIYDALVTRANAERRTIADVLNNILVEVFPSSSAKDKARRE